LAVHPVWAVASSELPLLASGFTVGSVATGGDELLV
jgi:hypothetical protein